VCVCACMCACVRVCEHTHFQTHLAYLHATDEWRLLIMSPTRCGSLEIYCGSLCYEPFVVVCVRNVNYGTEVQYSCFLL